ASPPGLELIQTSAGIDRYERRLNEPADFDGFYTGLCEHIRRIFSDARHQDSPAILQGFRQLFPSQDAAAGFGGHALPDAVETIFGPGPDLEPVCLSEVLIYQYPFHSRHCDIRPRSLVRRMTRAFRQAPAQLLGAVFSQQSNRVGPAPGAVPHLWQVTPGLCLDILDHLLAGLFYILERRITVGVH